MATRKFKQSDFVKTWVQNVYKLIKFVSRDPNFKTEYYFKNYGLTYEIENMLQDKENFISERVEFELEAVVREFVLNEKILELYENKFGKAEYIFKEEIVLISNEVFGNNE